MKQIVGRLVDQKPSEMSNHDRSYVRYSLCYAMAIITKDLEIQSSRRGQCKLLEVLKFIFNFEKNFFNRNNGDNQILNLKIRMGVIDLFLKGKGFTLLSTYMMERIDRESFPDVVTLQYVLSALGDSLTRRTISQQTTADQDTENDVIDIGRATMAFVSSCSGEELRRVLQMLRRRLSRLFDRLIVSRRDATYEYYEFWRYLALRLIKSPSLSLRLCGWEQIDDLLDASSKHRPPPRFFDVSNAGCTFVNGRYSCTVATTPDAYARNGVDASYERHIPEDEEDGGGKKLTLCRCIMRSTQKWWFFPEADEEQPGTDRDIDYYQHKCTKEPDKSVPPRDCWITCRNEGIDPPPKLQPLGLMVPAGQEFNTLEHHLAEWAIKNGIIDIVLSDSEHREIVPRSVGLIKFLGSMCSRDDGVDSTSGKAPNKYCLQVGDLLRAWNACPRKDDPTLSAQVYQLVASILPEYPGALAAPLLEALGATLNPR